MVPCRWMILLAEHDLVSFHECQIVQSHNSRPAQERAYCLMRVSAEGALTPPWLDVTVMGFCEHGVAYLPPRLQAGRGAPAIPMIFQLQHDDETFIFRWRKDRLDQNNGTGVVAEAGDPAVDPFPGWNPQIDAVNHRTK